MHKLMSGLITCALLAGCNDDGSSNEQYAATRTNYVIECPKNMTCGYMQAPKDYDKPNDELVDIFYGVHKATDPANRIGILLFNFGGPGAWAVGGAGVMADELLPQEIKERFDIVGMDPRGSGNSAFASELRECSIKKGSSRCDAVYAQFAPYMGSNSVIQDMDRLREMLNEEKLNYIGYSYGTRLGSLYAERYPDRVRSFVLDSSMSPTSFNNEMMRLDNTAGYHLVAGFRMEGNSERMDKLADIVERTSNYPFKYTSNDDFYFYQNNVYWLLDLIRTDGWERKSLQKPVYDLLDHGKARPLLCQLGLQSDCVANDLFSMDIGEIEKARSNAMFRAVICTDESLVLSDYDIDSKESAYIEKSNIYGSKTFEQLSGLCKGWQPPRDAIVTVSEQQVDLSGKQIVVIGGQYDSQTPYVWAKEMKDALGPDASLITVNNYVKHGFSYQKVSHPCVDKPVTQYLLDPNYRVGNVTCDSPSSAVMKRFDDVTRPAHPIESITFGL